MKIRKYSGEPDKVDYLVALLISALGLAIYVRTLAPDILYGDSAEFQCLSYTLGISHSTGYPTYLLLGRLLGLLPISNPAWRISLLSAVCAALTLGGVYLLARFFTRSRVGAGMGSFSLGISYTFWSQAVIAEVYTPGMSFLVVVVGLLFYWQTNPTKRNYSLFMAGLVAGMGFGVHASVWLVAPPAIALVFWSLWKLHASRTEWLKSILAGFMGATAGLVIFLVAFLVSNHLNSPTSFINTTLEPSRVFWGLQPEDFNSPIKRLKITVISTQWGDALFPGGDFSFKQELNNFTDRLIHLEFPPFVLIFAIIGLVLMLLIRPITGVFYPLNFFLSLFFILNYQVGDKYVFYLSLYIPLAVAVGTGVGFLFEWIHQIMAEIPGYSSWLLFILPFFFFVSMILQPTASVRWQALKSGEANFVTETYAFPVYNLEEPRSVAQMYLAGAASDAVFILDWRDMYTTAYLAYVEKGMTDTLFFEAMPRGNDGKVASTLITQLTTYLNESRQVFSEQRYPGLEEYFRILPASGNLYRLSLK